MPSHPCAGCPSCLAEIESLKARAFALELALRKVEDQIDTLWTPPWKKVWFVINGWPLYRVVDQPRHRPWHRWVRP